jgi:hypothetical protein
LRDLKCQQRFQLILFIDLSDNGYLCEVKIAALGD